METDLQQNMMKPVIVEKIEQVSNEINLLTKDIPQDPYDEEESEQRFLVSKPTCFIIIGKPGSGKTTLAQKFSQYWRCELMNAYTLVTDTLKSSDDRANSLWKILSRGEQISEEIVLQLLEEKIKSPEVTHHGYILDDYPTVCEDFMNIQDQFERIKTWKMSPDFIIYLRVPDEDLLPKRISQRIDPKTGDIYQEEVYNYMKPPKKELPLDGKNEFDPEEEEEAEETNELDADIVKSLLIRPEDLPEQADASIKKYKSNMLRILEEFMIDHDQDYVIELDATQPVDVLVQQIVTKLQLLGLCPAAVLQRLYDEDEDDPVEDLEGDEVMKTLCTKKTIAAQYPWKKSRWGKNCPVSLYEGSIIQGKPEYAVSFLDKMYFLSSVESMDKFLRNPRPYLLKPYPKAPCKISILGLPKSGKTSISYLLAEKYQGKVIQIQGILDEEMKKLEEETLKYWTQECTQNAIETVKMNVKKRISREFSQRKEERKREKIAEEKKKAEAEAEAEGKTPESEDEEKNLGTEEQDQNATEDTENKEVSEPTPEDAAKDTGDEPREMEEESSLEDPKPAQSSQLEIIVEDTEQIGSQGENDESEVKAETEATLATIDANHPEVIELVDTLLKTKGIPKVGLAPSRQFDILSECVLEEEKNMEQKKHIKNGGWILDDSPNNADMWQICAEKHWFPDNLLYLIDDSDDYEWSMQQWLNYLPQTDLDDTSRDAEKISTEPEVKEVIADKSVTDIEKGDDPSVKAEELEPTDVDSKVVIDGEDSASAITDQEKKDPSPDAKEEETATKTEDSEPAETESKLAVIEEGSATLVNLDMKEPSQISESPEYEPPKKAEPEIKEKKAPKGQSAYKENLKKADVNLSNIENTLSVYAYEPQKVDISNLMIEDILEKVVAEIEKPFQYQAIEYTLGDMDEDDENFEEEDEEEGEEEAEEEEEEEENVHRSRKRHLGNTSYYCPVMLQDKGILSPGKPDYCAKYANKLYYMSTGDALELFLQSPAMYVTKNNPPKPPAKRFSIIGVRGSGKTVYGRYLARKLGLFHISFHEKLQEMIMKKTGKKIGPRFADQDASPSESENEDDETETDKMKHFALQNNDDDDSTEIELTEEEEFIKANLESDSPLPADLLHSIISPWWSQEPYRSTGFILEGFPRNMDEAVALHDFELLFDAAIILNVEDNDVLNRLLPPKMEEWKAKINRQKQRLEKKKEKAHREKEEKMRKRREELEEEIAEKKRAKLEKESVDEKESLEEDQGEEHIEEEEIPDIEIMLLMEFQDEEEEEQPEDEEETEEDVFERFSAEISEMYEAEVTKLGQVQDTLEEGAIPRIVVDASRKQHIVKYVINKGLKPFVDFRDSIFERVYPVSENMARKLLNQGYKQPSCLGYWCPVNHQDNVTIQAMNNISDQKYPCIYRQHVYFLSSTEARDKFIKTPLSFVNSKTTTRPFVPIKLAIIGPPKSGKTLLCNRFSEKYGVERISVGIAARRVLETKPKSYLSSKILSYLCKGQLLPDDLAIEAIEVALLEINCQTKGYVFDGFPITKHQVDLLTARKIIPVKVIWLDIDSNEIVIRGVFDRQKLSPYMMHNSGKVLALKNQVFQREIKPVIEWYENEHQNLYRIIAKRSKWAVWEQAKEIALDSVGKIQNYLLNIKNGKAAALNGMCVTLKDFTDRLGEFGQFCPVSLGLNEELVDCSEDITMDLVAEFRGYYYKMATQENLELFMKDPEKFVPPNAPRALPPVELLPKRLISEEQERHLELKGYCPVTFLDGQCRYEAIVPGKPSLIVEYTKKFYSFASEKNLDTFMRLPTKYSDLKLPHKLPPKIDEMDILHLPHLGFMEQSVATPLIRALVAVGDVKPKYPFLTATHSALIYVAYHLKAFNPRNSDYIRKKYQQKLKRFEKDCELILYLGDRMTDFYINPADRSAEFNENIDTFFALKGFEPSLTWIG